MLNKPFIEKWIKALENGEFDQGTEQLRPYEDQYCCLGVACELYRREVGGTWLVDAANYSCHFTPTTLNITEYQELLAEDGDVLEEFMSIDTRQDVLPDAVARYIGISDGGDISSYKVAQRDDISELTFRSLFALNDELMYTFEEIAEVLREVLAEERAMEEGTHA